jgi:hypothetical protein
MRYQRTTPLARNKPQCGCRHFVSPSRVFAKVAKSKIPDGGWTMESFLTNNGRQLTKDLLAVQRAAKLKGSRLLTKPLTKVMRAQVELVLSLFEKSVIRYAGVEAVRSVKAVTTTLQVDAHGDLWAQAINDAFRILGKDVQATIQPVMQSVADDIHDKTTSLLTGGKPSIPAKRVMQQQVNEIASQVTRINKTTQTSLARLISKAVDDGKSPGELMDEIRNKIPQIATNRVPTIVRTELGRIADRAAIRSMKDSAVVTHVSVSGCEAIEQGIPTFRGTPTCNIKNVPIEYSGDLQFHINHTGAITASGFRQSNGATPSLPLKGGEGIGTWEDRGRPVPSLVSDGGPPKPPQSPPPSPPPAPIAPKPLPPTPPLAPAAPLVPVKPKPTPKPKPVVAPKPTPAPAPIPVVVDAVPEIAPAPVIAPIIPDPAPATPAVSPVTAIADSSPTPSTSPSWSPWNDVDEFNKSLTQKQNDALQDYVGDSRMVNDPLRRGTPLRPVDAELIDDLDSIFAKAPAIPNGTKVYRVIDEDDFESFYSGKTEWVDKGFVSTSSTTAARDALIDELYEMNLKPVVLEIEIGEGMSGLPLWAQGDGYFAYQKEVLLPRGRRFVFLGKEGDVVKLRVEVDDAAVIPAPIKQPEKANRLPGIPENKKFDRLNDFMSLFMSDEYAYRAQLAGIADWESVFDANIDKGSYTMQVARTFSDEKPTFLSRQEFLDKSKNMHPIGHFDRGVIHVNPLDELKKDKAWQGSGIFGDGYYHQLASIEKLNVEDTLSGKITETARDYASSAAEARVMTGFLSKEAKVIRYSEITAIRSELIDYIENLPLDSQLDFAEAYYGVADWTDLTKDMIKAVEGEFKALIKMVDYVEEVAKDRGALARLLGYDAIHVDNGRDFLVVVNNRHYNLLDVVAKRKNILDASFSFED